MQRAHQRRVMRDVEDVEAVAVLRRVHHPVERLVIAHVVGRQAEDRPHRFGDDFLGFDGGLAETRPAAVQPRIERLGVAVSPTLSLGKVRLRQVIRLDRAETDLLEEQRIPLPHQANHLANHDARLVRRVAGVDHPVQAMQHDARHRVHHRGERGDRDHVPGGLDRALLGVLLDLLQPLRGRRRPDVAQLFQDRERIVLEQRRELGVAVPRADDGPS